MDEPASLQKEEKNVKTHERTVTFHPSCLKRKALLSSATLQRCIIKMEAEGKGNPGVQKILISRAASSTPPSTPDTIFSIPPAVSQMMQLREKRRLSRVSSVPESPSPSVLKKRASLDLIDTTYNLQEIYDASRKETQNKLASVFPKTKQNSVKEHISNKVQVLMRLRRLSFLTQGRDDSMDEVMAATGRMPSGGRRKSILRKTLLSRSDSPAEAWVEEDDKKTLRKKISLTSVELQKELAIAKARARIEKDLDLPDSRFERLAELRINVGRIEKKFVALGRKTAARTIYKQNAQKEEEDTYYAPCRFLKFGQARTYFRRYARIILIVLQWINMIIDKQYNFEKELKSFVDIASEIEDQTVSQTMEEFGLTFDKKEYKASREVSLGSEMKKTLTTRSQYRTEEMIAQVMNGLQMLRSLSDYPLATQKRLCRVAWYQEIGAKKPIVRQGHKAESFYFILSGTAFVKKMTRESGETKIQTVARLSKGQSFGEIGLIFNMDRTATVESATPMELLVIRKEDFIDIFMETDSGEEAEHIQFLRQIPLLKNWPVEKLKDEPGSCILHFFKRGSLITENNKTSDWIYIVKSGTCEVLKKLKAVKARSPKEIRPKMNPLVDIILPELGMPNNSPKINSGKVRNRKVAMNADVYRGMIDFYDCLRRDREISASKENGNVGLPRIEVRPATSCQNNPQRRISNYRKEKTDGELILAKKQIKQVTFKMKPVQGPADDRRRSISRSKFDETSLPDISSVHFMLPTAAMLQEYRPTSSTSAYTHVDNHSKETDIVFVKVERLHPKDFFGLNTLRYSFGEDEYIFDDDTDIPQLSMVSRGAEVILLSKKTFMKYADERVRLSLRAFMKVYPSDQAMQENLQTEADWKLYKEFVLKDQLANVVERNVLADSLKT